MMLRQTFRPFQNKSYERCSLVDNPKIFEGYYQDYYISADILSKLAKSLGFSYDLYSTLSSINPESAYTMVSSMSKQNKIPEIVFLVDKETKEVINFSLESERPPILNDDFLYRVASLAEASDDDISISEIYHSKEDTIASVILKRKKPITIEEKYEGKDSKFIEYQIGIILINDELNSVSSRLVVYVEGQPLYLPASYYSATTTRYKRSTSSTTEALEVLVLKIINDLREEDLMYKLQEFHYSYRFNKSILSSYEEYNAVLRTMRKIPTIIEDNSILEDLLSKYENFEKRYSHLEDKKSSYVWRCTALSDITIGSLVSITASILSDLQAPALEYYDIRDLLGSYISTNRIAEDIAQEDIK